MKKIFLVAYDNTNLGDDLFIDILCRRYRHVKFIFSTTKEYIKVHKGGIPNIQYIDKRIVTVLNHIGCKNIIKKRCDACVYIGGSLFIEHSNWKAERKYFTSVFNSSDTKFLLLGANFGPYKDKTFFEFYKEIFRNATDISFRDRFTYELFNELDNVRYNDDIVFSYPIEKPAFRVPKTIGISVIGFKNKQGLKAYESKYLAKLLEIIRFYITADYEVTLFSFCRNEGDEDMVAHICGRLQPAEIRRVRCCFYTGKIEPFIDEFRKMSYIIATRFHSMILGFVFDQPVFPIVYSNKMQNVLDDIGFSGISCNIRDIENLTTEQVYKNFDRQLIDVSAQKKRAVEHFRILDQILS